MARSEGGRRLQSNDSDNEESMRTPPRAQYGSGAPAIDKSPNWEVRASTGKMETSASTAVGRRP
eukprot:scaffold11439_cov122-Isochrysis_galbana.AAC.1